MERRERETRPVSYSAAAIFSRETSPPSRRTTNTSTTPDPDPEILPPGTSTSSIIYKECLKNHAAAMGRHAVDGCGEFMPTGGEGTPEELICAACNCHRSFHRKEIDGDYYYSHRNNPTSYNTHRTPPLPPPASSRGNSVEGATESSSEDRNGIPVRRRKTKRFRTKFSSEQKEEMRELAEKLGWKIQRQDEEQVQDFCHKNGVTKQVFKVWMHNNKRLMKKTKMP